VTEPAAETLGTPFLLGSASALDEIERQIGLLLDAKLIDSYAASIYRLYVAALRDEATKPKDRMVAITALGKLRGLFVTVLRNVDEDLADKPTHELLKALAQQMNLPLNLAERVPGRNGKITDPPPVRLLGTDE
jgi:hypothetical protein